MDVDAVEALQDLLDEYGTETVLTCLALIVASKLQPGLVSALDLAGRG